MAKATVGVILIAGLCATHLGSAGAPPADAGQGEFHAAPHAAAIPDYCDGVVDPYNPVDQRTRFYQACGPDGELDRKEFAANQGADNCFAYKFDSWMVLMAFDANHNDTIDWFEADAYRKSLRARLLAAFDADGDGQLIGAERESANRSLAAGRTTPLPAGSTRPVATPSQPGEAPAGGLPVGELSDRDAQTLREAWLKRAEEELQKEDELDRFDRNNDGQLDAEEHKALDEYRAQQEKARKEWLAKFDADGDGKLAPKEQRAADRAADDERRRQILELYDTNRDGKLDHTEHQAMDEAWRKRLDESRTRQELRRFDVNRNGRIDPDERAAMEKYRAEQAKAQQEWIRRFDTNGDGRLSGAERREMHRVLRQILAAAPARPTSDAEGGTEDLEGPDDEDPAPPEMTAEPDDPNASYLQRLLKKYDADGDGKLSSEERARMWRDQYDKAIGPGGQDSHRKD